MSGERKKGKEKERGAGGTQVEFCLKHKERNG